MSHVSLAFGVSAARIVMRPKPLRDGGWITAPDTSRIVHSKRQALPATPVKRAARALPRTGGTLLDQIEAMWIHF